MQATKQTFDKDECEVNWATLAVAPQHKSLWSTYGSRHQLGASLGSTFVIWQLTQGTPDPVAHLTVESVGMDMHTGVSLSLVGDDSRSHSIGHIPRLIHGIFIWMPFFCEVRFAPSDYGSPHDPKLIRVTFCVKSKYTLKKPPVEGGFYITSLRDFNKLHSNNNY